MKNFTSKKIIKIIRNKIEIYFKQNKKIYAVFGKSMGIDSSVVAGLLSNIPGIIPIGVIMPCESDTKDEIIAKKVLNFYSISYLKFDLTKEYQILTKKLYDKKILAKLNKLTELNQLADKKQKALGNIKVRLRMITLYHLAGILDGIVIGTGNLSEYMTGFWTLHGDVGDFYPILSLYKSNEVYQLAKELKVPAESITAIPSDGLNITNNGVDEDQLGLPYKELDKVIKNYLLGKNITKISQQTGISKEKVQSTINKIILSEFKRKLPIVLSRKDFNLV